jgi:hypothetical protein
MNGELREKKEGTLPEPTPPKFHQPNLGIEVAHNSQFVRAGESLCNMASKAHATSGTKPYIAF